VSKDTERVTVRLSEDRVEWLDAQSDNRSAFIRRLIDQARGGEHGVEAALRTFRREQLAVERESLLQRAELVKEQMGRLSEREKHERQEAEALAQKFVDEFPTVAPDSTHPAVKNWARKADVNPAEFTDMIEQYRDDEPAEGLL